MPTQTAADQIIAAEDVVLARENPDKPFTYRAVDVLKGEIAAPDIDLFANSGVRRLLAADAYERGERDDQEGAYSDEEDEDDDGFGDYKPLTVEQVWNGDTVLTGETPDSSRLLGMTTE